MSPMPLDAALFPLPEGTKGFDCNFAVTPAQAESFYQRGYRFAVRYIRRQKFHAFDLTQSEASVLMNAGLGVMLVQHVESAESWDPTEQKGEEYGATAAAEATKLYVPAGTLVWCDLEGVDKNTPPERVIAYCKSWYEKVHGAGYDPGLYVGWRAGLNAKDLYWKLPFKRYWAAYNLNNDQYPVVRGVQMQQRAWPGAIPRVSQQFDIDYSRADAFGSSPLVFARADWKV